MGLVAVGFLAIPVMSAGAAYDVCQTFRWNYGLSKRPSEAKQFYATIVIVTVIAMAINFFGFNAMRTLVWAAIFQGLTTPPLFLLMLFMTNNRRIMGEQVNGWPLNILCGITLLAIVAATIGLFVSIF